MITGYVHGQMLKLSAVHAAADTINYLTARFVFQTSDWNGLEVWSHWAKGDTVYDIRLDDGRITEDMHLNLSAGVWSVYLHGNRYDGGEVVQRVTTVAQTLQVLPTGTIDGEPFPEMPASVTEQILARLENAEQSGGGTGGPAESIVNRTRSAQPLVTFVDDDGRAAVWDKLKPLSERYGIPFVSAMVTDRIGQNGSLTAEQLVSLQNMGWEIASHTMGHVRLGDLTDAEQEAQLRGSKEALESIGIKCDSICYPVSSVSDSTWKIARKYYRCGRQTNWKEWLNETPLETWDLRITPIGSYYETQTESGLDTSTLEYYKYQVDRAVSGNAWLIFMTHCAEMDETQMGHLVKVIEYVQSLGIPAVTMREGLDRRGNIVDVGRYDRRNLEVEHFVVGCDSTVDKSAPDKHAVNLPTNAVTNDTPPSWFPWNTVSTCKVTGNTGGFPFQSVYYGGTLLTNTMGSAATHDLVYKDYTDGRTWQEFYIPDSPAVYRRCAIDADTWSDWSYGSDIVLAQDSRAIDDVVSKFPIGLKTKVWITRDGATAKRPDGINGWLITDRTDVNGRLFWQTWIPMTQDNPKGNVYFRRWTGSAWQDWTCLGERTGSSNMRAWSITPKYVGAQVFDTTLGKPVWYNGTAWVDATGTVV